MSEKLILPVSVVRAAGDYGREYGEVTVGTVTVTVYQSEVRPGCVTIDIDAPEWETVSVTMNDWEINLTEDRT